MNSGVIGVKDGPDGWSDVHKALLYCASQPHAVMHTCAVVLDVHTCDSCSHSTLQVRALRPETKLRSSQTGFLVKSIKRNKVNELRLSLVLSWIC